MPGPYANAPFGDHVGPSLQSDVALAGHCPARSLEVARGEKYQRHDDEAAHPATIPCTPPCGPYRLLQVEKPRSMIKHIHFLTWSASDTF